MREYVCAGDAKDQFISVSLLPRANLLIRRLLYSVLVVAACQAEIIDRLAVTVGKEVITESDVIRDLRISAMLDQKPVDLSGPEKRKAADRLVDQALILKEAAFIRVAMPSLEDQDRMLQQVKTQYPSE